MWQKGEAKSAHAFENSASNCRDRRADENDVSFDTVSKEVSQQSACATTKVCTTSRF